MPILCILLSTLRKRHVVSYNKTKKDKSAGHPDLSRMTKWSLTSFNLGFNLTDADGRMEARPDLGRKGFPGRWRGAALKLKPKLALRDRERGGRLSVEASLFMPLYLMCFYTAHPIMQRCARWEGTRWSEVRLNWPEIALWSQIRRLENPQIWAHRPKCVRRVTDFL